MECAVWACALIRIQSCNLFEGEEDQSTELQARACAFQFFKFMNLKAKSLSKEAEAIRKLLMWGQIKIDFYRAEK